MEQSLTELAQRALKGLLIDGDLSNFMSKFERLKTYEEKFALLWDLKGMREMLTLPMVKSEKSELEANRLRSEGNSYYKKNNFGKALELFNLSIMASPHPVIHGSTTAHQETSRGDGMFACPFIDPVLYGGVTKSESKALALGYANRSALMFELRFYEKCLIDINLAFESGYPEELHLKLHNRKEKCMKFLTSDSPLTDKDLSSSRKAENCFTVTGSESLKNWSEGLKIIEGKSTSVYSDLQSKHIVLENLLMMKHGHTPKLLKSNPEIPAFSDAVDMTYTTSKGRGLIALRNIRPGDVIGVERAYCVSLHSHMFSSYCSSCLEMCLNPVPCPSCSKVVYCNELCRMTGLAEDHWIDCRILPTLIAFEITSTSSFGHKVLKNFTCGQLKCMIKELQRERLDCPEKLGYNSEGLYSSTSYQAVYHLCTSTEWKTSKMFFSWQVSVAITKVLQQSGRYFVNIDNEAVDPSRDDIIVTGAAIFSHMMKEQVNSYALADAQWEKSVGSGVFPALSLINHSCNPGALHYNCGRTLVVRAIKPIKAGEEITVSYADSFWQRERKLREEHLKAYGINCTCEACKNNWPLLGDLPPCNGKCFTCLQSLEGDNFLCDDCILPLTLEQIAKKRLELYNRVQYLDKEMSLIFSKLANREVTKEQIKFLFETIESLYKFEAAPSQRHCKLSVMLKIAFRSGF